MPYKNLSILAADDDMEDLELIEEAILSIQPNAQLHKVANGKEVIEYLSKQHDDELPCLIILDYNMPELTGSQVLELICKQPRYDNIAKVVFSTSSTPLHIHECMQHGATEYLVKPNNIHDLHLVAKKMLGYCPLN